MKLMTTLESDMKRCSEILELMLRTWKITITIPEIVLAKKIAQISKTKIHGVREEKKKIELMEILIFMVAKEAAEMVPQEVYPMGEDLPEGKEHMEIKMEIIEVEIMEIIVIQMVEDLEVDMEMMMGDKEIHMEAIQIIEMIETVEETLMTAEMTEIIMAIHQ